MEGAHIKRAFGLLIRRVGGTTLLTVALVGLALGSVAWSLSQIVRGLDFELLATMLTTGACMGWLTARSRLHGLAALPLVVVTAIVWVFVRVGNLTGDLLAFLGALAFALWELQFGRIRMQTVTTTFGTLYSDVVTLVIHLDNWRIGLGKAALDFVGPAMVWSLALVLLAAWVAWMLRRTKQPLTAFAPVVVLFALVLAYTGRIEWAMIFVFGALLALMVLVPYAAREEHWRIKQTPTAQDLGFDLALIAVPAIAGIVVLALIVPAFSPREIARLVQEWTRPSVVADTTNPLTSSFGLEPAPRPTTVFDTVSSPGLPRSHLLGAAPELLKQTALTVQIENVTSESLPYYWLSTTYDLYTGRGWWTRSIQTVSYRANENAGSEAVGPSRTVRQTLRVEREDGLVYAAGSVVTVDHDFQIAWRENQDLFAAVVGTGEFRVESRMPVFTAQDLRGAGTGYPPWVLADYLSLPEDLPPRVLALSRDLTARAPTPYDRALAIQDYLRTLPYTLDLPAPPPDRDVVDYFLFDLKRGYCDYYATAMAVLARAAGLPARVAVGYATGKYIPSTGTYVVTEADAHSWTQVYFPDYGWIDFEPTSARSLIAYDALDSVSEDIPPVHGEGTTGINPTADRGLVGNGWLVIPGALGLLLAAALSLVPLDTLRLKRMLPHQAITRLYLRMFRVARLLGLDVSASSTPHQVEQQLQQYLAHEARPRRLENVWQTANTAAAQIAELYTDTTYGAHPLTAQQTHAVIQRWQAVQWHLWLAIVTRTIQERVRKIKNAA